MDNLALRRIIAVVGIVIAFLGLTSFLWGLLKYNQAYQLAGLVFILVAYVLVRIIKKLKEKAQPPGKGSKVE
jgi:inner membrane protein involved in colicin E2 resistance